MSKKLTWVDNYLADGLLESSSLFIGRQHVGIIFITRRISTEITFEFELSSPFDFGVVGKNLNTFEKSFEVNSQYFSSEALIQIYKEFLTTFKKDLETELKTACLEFKKSSTYSLIEYYTKGE